MAWTEVFQLPNLLSLSRILLTPFIGYYLRRGDDHAALIALGLVILAAITDGLDGYFARRSHRTGDLGKILDPVADKVFAGILVVLLTLFRDMPVWLAAMIIGRDLLIAGGGLLVIRQRKIVNTSNLTGKYAFTVTAFLLASYIARFDFGIAMMTYLAVIMIVASLVGYGRVFAAVIGGRPAPVFNDRPAYRVMRMIVSLIVLGLFLYNLAVSWLPRHF